MNSKALELFTRSIIREILASEESDPGADAGSERGYPEPDFPGAPSPRLDFTPESDPEFQAKLAEERARLEMDLAQEAEMSDRVTDRARRIRERQWAEDNLMRGMAPPEE